MPPRPLPDPLPRDDQACLRDVGRARVTKELRLMVNRHGRPALRFPHVHADGGRLCHAAVDWPRGAWRPEAMEQP